MTAVTGTCHCGNVGFEFDTPYSEDEIPIRACQCTFCRKHGAATARDPNGNARILIENPAEVTRYRFGTGTTDFVICAVCGVYVGAVIVEDGRSFATLNMRLTSLDVARAEPVHYDNEAADERVARRVKLFTPLRGYPLVDV